MHVCRTVCICHTKRMSVNLLAKQMRVGEKSREWYVCVLVFVLYVFVFV